MAVKEGYKLTEVGILPKEWEVVQFGTCIKKTRLGGNYNNSSIPTAYPLIKMGNISRGYINLDKIEYVQGVIPIEVDKLKYGDLLFNTRNTLELVGKVAIWKNELSKAYYNSNLMNIIFDEKYIKTSSFVNYMFNSKLMLNKLGDIAIGTTSVAAIYNRDLLKIPFPVPPLPEQKAIATALSDIDGLINSLTKLIEKKKNIKQGAMQELLTGKKKLDGFSGEWEERHLGDIADIISGGTPKTSIPEYWNGEISWCTPTDITRCKIKYLSETEKSITILGLKNSSASLLPKGALLFCSRATIGEVKIAHSDICTNQGFKSLIVNPDIINEWLYYWIILNKAVFDEKAIGSTFLEISKKDIKKILIKVPTNEEQTAIATILSDMDSEIEKLQTKLDKYKAIKLGMMQELLTGRIRLLEGA